MYIDTRGPAAASARPCSRAGLTLLATCSLIALAAPGHADSYVVNQKSATRGDPGQNFNYTNDQDRVASGNGVIVLKGEGAQGSNSVSDSSGRYRAGTGGVGGQAIVTNTGDLSIEAPADTSVNGLGNGDSSGLGMFDRLGLLTGINVAELGGAGGDADGDGGGSGDGGDGGAGGVVQITNSGAITIEQAFPQGGVGIFATSGGGNGGHENGGAGDGGQDDMGGAGGHSGEVTVTNSGAITLSGDGPLTVQGIRIESFAGNGGIENGGGGITYKSTVTDTGTIDVTAANTSGTEMENGIAGISVFNRSGNGAQSDDNSDAGGGGGAPGEIEIDSSGDITVNASGLQPYTNDANRAGGIIALSQGGRGGNSPSPDGSEGSPAGNGGGADYQVGVVAHGSTIAVTGDRTIGIGAFSHGGDGGTGRAQADAGDGGRGGQPRVETHGQQAITTDGLMATGIFAKSEGGTGGGQDEDGDGVLDFQDPTAGDGGNGNTVTVIAGSDANYGAFDVGGTITTHGNQAHGIHALSFGAAGGGATGSFVIAGSTVADGGGGGNGGAVNVTSSSGITTFDKFAVGVMAQSIGGGGGDVDPDSVAEGDLIAVAGSGGEGGGASAVTVKNYGDIVTHEEAALAILAQSIGGGGGNGGSTDGVAAVGGVGGGGGSGGAVATTLFEQVQISTAGDHAFGVVAQSIGGGGGHGGSVIDLSLGLPAVGIGGSGGGGGNGGGVSLTTTQTGDGALSTTISTAGANAHALIGQSIGGGGGTGGDASGATIGLGNFQMAGGAGGGGSAAKAAAVVGSTRILTTGSHASGVMMQSIGGGGGAGGMASGYDLDLGLSLAAQVGGSGGNGGNGGEVDVTLQGSVVATGLAPGGQRGQANPWQVNHDASDGHGVIAQSIGGGGGYGGGSVGRSRAIAVPTGGEGSYAASLDVSAGGSGAGGGAGGAVHVLLESSGIETHGHGAMGVFAQSISGGGGIGGSASAAGGVVGIGDTVSATINAAVGGSGGNAAAAGEVYVQLREGSTITTAGDYANAVMAQSIGGGGGAAATGSAGARSFLTGPSVSLTFGVGGTGGDGGAGGTVKLGMDGNAAIATYGEGSRGVLMQSVGGGGGASQGMTAGLSVSKIKSTGQLNIGRTGGSGGVGGDLTQIDVTGSIFTYGADADGILAQSVGGGGGVGGSVGGASADDTGILLELKDLKSDESSPFDLRASIGGRGGSGQHGGDVSNLRLSGTVQTFGDFSEGVLVQSIGGGGGAGGAGNVQTSRSKIRTYVALGGYGGIGGDGGDIAYDLDGGAIMTQGFAAHGLALQTLGGGGGSGGSGARLACGKINLGGGFLAPEIPVDDPTPDDLCVTVPSFLSVDGQNGVSGHGGDIAAAMPGDATRSLSVATTGRHAHGIIVQSLGGGGGIGGIGSSTVTQDDADQDVDHDIDVYLGGSAAAAGHGGAATLEGALSLQTTGAGAFGAVVQSLGGGGGIAAVDGITGLFMGGNGFQSNDSNTADGDAATLHAFSDSAILTNGEGGHGLVAQSLGGGGGIVTGALAPEGGGGGGIGVYVGGNGGTRAYGGDVGLTLEGDADDYATVVTTGRFARGLIAQSVGGGGGQYTGVQDGSGGPAKAVTTQLGARDGGGHAGEVAVTLGGAIQTSGHGADGILAQSIGAGGGGIDLSPRGGSSRQLDIIVGAQDGSEGDGKSVTLVGDWAGGSAQNASIQTQGDFAYGVLLQSIGGGGGLVDDPTGSGVGSVTLGAKGGDGGAGGAVQFAASEFSSVTGFHKVTTAGDDAHAIVAQSIGAGGGVARVSGAAGGVDAAVGGADVSVANADDVDLQIAEAAIVTAGDRAMGIVAQSIGGGGGLLSVGSGAALGSYDIGGAGGSAGNVDIFAYTGVSIATAGDGAHGIVAQSIGGGGGIIGDFGAGKPVLKTYDGTAAIDNQGGNGGAVSISIEGAITTTGHHAYGVIAQAVGSGGGLVGDGAVSMAGSLGGGDGSGTTTGAIEILQYAGSVISTSGEDSTGIFAHSVATANSDTISITVDGTVTGGTGNGVGIYMAGGSFGVSALPDNTIDIGLNGEVSAGSGTAIEYQSIYGGAQGVTVTNSGRIVGDVLGYAVDGSPYAPTVFGGQPETSRVAAPEPHRTSVARLVNKRQGTLIGAGRYLADVENWGALIPGDDGSAERVRISGDFVQTSTGRLVAALDFGAGEGDLLHVNGSALLDGALEIDPITLAPSRAITLIEAEGGLSGGFDDILSDLFEFGMEIENDALSIQVTGANFDQERFGLDAQQRRVAGYLENLFMADTGTHAAFFGAMETLAGQGAGAYATALTGLAPGATLAGAAANFSLAHDRLDSLMGCGEALDPVAQDACVRMLGGATRLDQQTGADGTFGYEGDVWRIGVAGQAQVAPDWFAGGALGYESGSFTSQTGLSSSQGDTVFAGLSATRAMGAFTLTGAVSGSWGQHDLRRNPDGLLMTGRADAETDVWSLAARVRGAWTMAFHQGWLTPALDLDVIHSAAGGFTESGPATTALQVSGSSETAFVATPSLEVGAWTPVTQTVALKAWARVGASLSSLDAYTTSARFASAGAAGGGFDSAVGVADVVGRISAGVTLAEAGRASLDLGYSGAFADGYASHSGRLEANVRF